MTTGVPGRGDGGYADAPTAPTPLAWGAGGHTPTQPLPGVPHTPTSPGMPPAGPGGGRALRRGPAPRLPRWLRRFLIAILALALVGALAFAALLLVTPSVSTAPSLAQAFDQAHGVAYPGPAGAVTVRRLAGRHRGSPVLLRTRLRPHRDRPGDHRPRHRAARPGRRHALPATGQDALHAGPGRCAASRWSRSSWASSWTSATPSRRSCGCTPTSPTSVTGTTAWPRRAAATSA